MGRIPAQDEGEYVGIFIESDHILAPDKLTRVSGSVRLDHDLRRDLRALDPHGDVEARREKRRGDMPSVPEGKHWCSHYDHEGKDEQGKDDGGWRPVGEFTTYRDKTGKMRPHEHCNGCRAKHRRKMYALMREAEGKTVRPWNRRQVAC